MGYRNIFYKPKEECVTLLTWDEKGKRVSYDVSVEPYAYIEGNGEYESIFGTKLIKKTFRNQYDRYRYLKDTHTKRIFDNFPVTQQFLLDTFWKDNEKPEFAQYPIKICFVDIEVYAPDEFPHADKALEPINVITVYESLTNKFYTWGTKPYKNTESDVVYVYCKSEEQLLTKFVEFMESDYPDILSGWNSETFDIPYIINRTAKLLGEEFVNRLSPAGRVYNREMRGKFGQMQVRWFIEGISVVDYLDIYKRFCLSQRESFKLTSITEAELGEGKVNFGTMNLATLADTDWDTFVKYNIQDVRLLSKLEAKLKYLELLRMLAYVGLTTFEGAMGTLSVINGSTAIRARYRNQKIPSFIREEDDGSINPGAFVAEPLKGFQTHVVSFDASSLYPSVMISLNMSPETKVGTIETIDGKIKLRHVSGKAYMLTPEKFEKFKEIEKIAVSKANVLFTQKKKGIMPEILDFYYDKRQEVRKQISELKKKYAENKDKVLKDQIDQLNAKQLCIKVYINSIYGFFGNKHAAFGDDDVASSITLTGQAVVKQANDIAKAFIKKLVPDISEDTLTKCIVYNDTDSGYVSIKPLVDAGLFPFKGPDGKLSKETYKTVADIEAFLNKEIKIWGAKELGSTDCRFLFKREVIAEVGIFLEKKRYVLNVLDDEGIPCNKYKYTGVEVVRSTMPATIKPHMKRIIETMLTTRNMEATTAVLNEIYEIFKKLPVQDITLVSGLSKLEEKTAQCNGFATVKGMPCHAKAAYFHNHLLQLLGLSNKYENIQSGDKVRYFYIEKPNKYGIEAIGYKYNYPEEFNEFFKPDYEQMFQRHIFSAIERFFANVNWFAQKPGSRVQTNLFELLA